MSSLPAILERPRMEMDDNAAWHVRGGAGVAHRSRLDGRFILIQHARLVNEDGNLGCLTFAAGLNKAATSGILVMVGSGEGAKWHS